MDLSTTVVISAFIVSAISVLFIKSTVRFGRQMIFAAVLFTFIYLTLSLLGELTINLGYNSSCSKYIGCNSGFFGFDAFEHYFFGASLGFFVIWLGQKRRFSLFFKELWKTIIVLIAVTALVSVFWEILEFLHDLIRVHIMNEHLIDFKLNLNLLDQPNNIDTMGDLIFALLGTGSAILAALFISKESLRQNTENQPIRLSMHRFPLLEKKPGFLYYSAVATNRSKTQDILSR